MKMYNKKFLLALFLAVVSAGCGSNGGGTSSDLTIDIIVPTVSSTNPSDGDTGVFINRDITLTFSEAIDPATITIITFTLMQGTTPVLGTVTSSGSLATFTPSSNLIAGTDYTAMMTTGAEDLAGNALAISYDWSFTTGSEADPTVSSTNPINTATGVAINQNVAVTFSEDIDPLTCTTTTFTLLQGVTPVDGTVNCVDKTATFNPTSDLAINTEFTATITTGMKDLAGNPLAGNNTWTFTTSGTADTTAPTVGSTDPEDMATGVATNRDITATFSEATDPATITETTFTLMQGATPVAGAVTSAGSVVTFNPTSDLAISTLYTATITNGATDLAGNALASNFTWTFTTGSTTAAGPAPVVLGTAGDFALLSKSGITNVPTSAITGNIGTSPITGAAIDLTCAEVTGTIYAVDAAGPLPCSVVDPTLLTTAVGDMEIAYTDAAGRTLPDATELGAGEIGGLTIVPGLYKWSSNVLITTDVVLSGGANDVWIFQISGDLTQANGQNVTLAGGAQAKNIFWQVGGGTGVTIGTTAHFEGTVLAIKAIHLNTGAVMNGRALAQTAVTLQQNTVTKPAP